MDYRGFKEEKRHTKSIGSFISCRDDRAQNLSSRISYIDQSTMSANPPSSLQQSGDRSSITRSTDITLILLSTAFVIARLYVRKFVTCNLGLDDCAALISLVSGLDKIHVAMIWHLFTAIHNSASSQQLLLWNSLVRFVDVLFSRLISNTG